jgi:hypothetical protein
MLIALVPLAVAIAGALIYGFCDGKKAEVGRILLFCGVLVLVAMMSGRTVKI